MQFEYSIMIIPYRNNHFSIILKMILIYSAW